MKLLVVRHGRTRSNAEGRYQGSIDTELDDVGIEQARALDAALPRDIDAAASSPLRRARLTAEIFCAARGLPLGIVEEFRERGGGVFEGLTYAEARERHAELWARNVMAQWEEAPPGGESVLMVAERVVRGLEALRANYDGRRLVLFAHGFVARVIRAACTDRFDDFFGWTLENAATLEVEIPRFMPDDYARWRAAFLATGERAEAPSEPKPPARATGA